MALKASITLKGHTADDLVDALNEVKRLIEEGFTSGFNNNDTGGYTFECDGEEEKYPEEMD